MFKQQLIADLRRFPMADENDVAALDNTTANELTDTTTAKKTRKPRRSKAEIEATNAAKSQASAKKTRAKRGSKAELAATPKVASRKTTKSIVAAPVNESEVPVAEPLDEIGVLLQLEEENKALRKQLSDKLRQENADLRKRLGHN
jgi:hypothetical protein